MNKYVVFISVMFVSLMLAACGDSKADGGKVSEGDVDKLSYSLAEDISSEHSFLHNLQIDHSGKAIMYGEGSQGDEHPKLYVDGEITDLDTDWFDMHSYMTRNGKVIGDQADHDNEVYTYRFYDAFSGEKEDYKLNLSAIDFLTFTLRSSYMEDENGDVDIVLRDQTTSNEFWVDIVDFAADSHETIDFTDRMADYLTSDYDEPSTIFSNDGEKFYIVIESAYSDSGDDSTLVFSYDIESDELDKVAEMDEGMWIADHEAPLTSDGEKLLLYGDDYVFYMLDVDSGELEEQGEGKYVSNLDGNKIAYLDDETGEITIKNLEDGESNVVYTIEKMDDIQMENFAISYNGATIAYMFQDRESEEKDHHLHILSVE